jgi:protein-L-isoaspartate(D-aspartate) O-methyltransferase
MVGAAPVAGNKIQPNVRAVQGDGAQLDFAPADVVNVNAGVTRPADAWPDLLGDGGRLMLPMTANEFPRGDIRQGAVFKITRQGNDFLAKRVSSVAIFPCVGMRDMEAEAALSAAFAGGGAEAVTRLYRHDNLPDAQCWLRGRGWCLAYG